MNKKIVLSFLIFVLLLIGLGMATVLVQKRQEIRKKAAVDYTASLSLSPAEVEVQQLETFEVDLILNPDGQEAAAVDVVINFDPNLLHVYSLEPNYDAFQTFAPVQESGDFDEDGVITEANISGKLEFGAVTFNWEGGTLTGGVSESVNLMRITFWANNPGEDSITFGFDGLGQTTDSNVVAISGEEVVDILQDISGNTTEVTISGEATPTPTPTPTSVLTPTPTPTTSPEIGNLRFQIRFQGINGAQPATMQVRGILKQGAVEKYPPENIIVENDGTGVFVGMFNDISVGTYDVFIKGPSHLQKGFCGVTFIAGQTVEKDWTSNKLLAGDFIDDNQLNFMDLASMLVLYVDFSIPVNDDNRVYDVDGNGFIDFKDIATVLTNYTDFKIDGDKICE